MIFPNLFSFVCVCVCVCLQVYAISVTRVSAQIGFCAKLFFARGTECTVLCVCAQLFFAGGFSLLCVCAVHCAHVCLRETKVTCCQLSHQRLLDVVWACSCWGPSSQFVLTITPSKEIHSTLASRVREYMYLPENFLFMRSTLKRPPYDCVS